MFVLLQVVSWTVNCLGHVLLFLRDVQYHEGLPDCKSWFWGSEYCSEKNIDYFEFSDRKGVEEPFF